MPTDSAYSVLKQVKHSGIEMYAATLDLFQSRTLGTVNAAMVSIIYSNVDLWKGMFSGENFIGKKAFVVYGGDTPVLRVSSQSWLL